MTTTRGARHDHSSSTTSRWCTDPANATLATRVFELLNMRVVDNGGEWMFALVDPSIGDAREQRVLRLADHG